MSIEIVDVSGCRRNLVAEIPAEQVDREINRLAQDYARKVNVPGFRPGKAPLSIIKQRFGAELRSDATQDLIQRCWKDALSERSLHPLDEPVVEDIRGEPGEALRFTVSFEVLPQLEVKDYLNVPASLNVAAVEDADVERALEALRDQHAAFVPVEDREVRDGDLVTMTVDGEFEGGGRPVHEEDVTCVVGEAGTHEAFSENLRGARAGETRAFEVRYPPETEQKRFAGKLVRYQAALRDVKEKQLPDLEDLAKDLGAPGAEALRERVRNEMVMRARRDAEKSAREAVLDEIVRRNPVDAPECLVRSRLHDHLQRIASSLARQGLSLNSDSPELQRLLEQERPHAEQTVRRSIVLDAVAKQEGIQVTDEELDQEFRKLAEASGKSVAAIRAQLEKDERIQGFREHLRTNKALDFVFRNANISGG